MKKEREETMQEILAAMKAEDILDEIRSFLEKSDKKNEKQAVWDIIRKGEEADGFYLS